MQRVDFSLGRILKVIILPPWKIKHTSNIDIKTVKSIVFIYRAKFTADLIAMTYQL